MVKLTNEEKQARRKETQRQWYLKHKSQAKAKRAEYRKSHPEMFSRASAKWGISLRGRFKHLLY